MPLKRDPDKQRAWRQRSKGLKRTGGPKRTGGLKRTPIARKNPERRAKMFERNFGERGDPVRAMMCLASGHRSDPCSGPIQACHAIARGMGGVKGDRRCLVPLCAKHHRASGEHGTSQREAFEKKHKIDLVAEAERIAKELDEQGIP